MPSENSDQPAHSCSLIISFTGHILDSQGCEISSCGQQKHAVFIGYMSVGTFPANILYKSIAGRYWPVSYPDGPITARYRFIKNAYRVFSRCDSYTDKLGLGGSVGCASDWRPGGRGFDPRRSRQHSFVEIDLFVLRFYGPVNPMGSCRARSVYLTTRLLGRLSPLINCQPIHAIPFTLYISFKIFLVICA